MIVFILVFWLILSNQFSSFFIIAAIASSLLVTLVNRKIFSPLEFHFKYRQLWRILNLFKDMLYSSCSVAKIIWLNKPITSSIKWQKIPKTGIAEQVAIANAITLTPGTMSMGLKDNKILIHEIEEKR